MRRSSLSEQLLRATDAERRQSLLERAAQSEECLLELLDVAGKSLPGAAVQAVHAADLAIDLAQRRSAWREGALAWRTRARSLRLLGRHQEAVAAFASAAEYAERAGDPLLAAQVQVGRVDSLGWLGQFDEALTLAERLETQLLAVGAEHEAARVLMNVAGLYFRRDRYTEALDCNLRALEIGRRNGDPVLVATLEANHANLLTYLDRVDEAIALFERVGIDLAANGLADEAAKTEGNIGYLHYTSGRFAAALGTQLRVRGQFAQLGQEVETAKADADLGAIYRALNLYPEALECYGRALETLQRLGVDDESARTGVGYAGVLMVLERAEEAFAALERAEAIFRRQKNRLQLAHVRLMRAYLLRSVGQSEAACVEARAATAGLARCGLAGWAAEARYLLADVAREQGRTDARAMQSVAKIAKNTGRGWLYCRAERALGIIHGERGRTEEALRHLRAGVAALEEARTLVAPEELHVAFLRDKLAIYEDLVHTLLMRGTRRDVAEALEYVEQAKSRLLLERVQTALDNRLPVAEPARTDAQSRLAALRADLSRAYHRAQPFDQEESRSLGGGVITAPALAQLERAYRETLREVEIAEAERGGSVSALTVIADLSTIQDALDPDQTLVEYYICSGQVTAFVITRDRVVTRVGIAPLAKVEYELRRLRYQLQKVAVSSDYVQRHSFNLQSGAQEALQRLYQLLLLPLEPLLTNPKLVIVPHGALHGLPYHACYDGRSYALDRWEILYAPSATVWRLGVQRQRRQPPMAEPITEAHALVMGVPWPGIERVALEVDQIAMVLPQVQRFCGEECTLETFRNHAGQCRLIHLATHALFRADNPLFSGLRFADGWLLARDLYDMRLESELVTLSACQTGAASVEPGDELFGLIRGFLNAGAHTLAVSLWPADDRATAELMSCFYTKLSEGTSKTAALRTAQQRLRELYPHPYYWAAFVLVGER
jgi:CHAT domain-containing protein